MPITLNTKIFSFSGFIQGAIARYLNAGTGTAAGFKLLTSKVEEPTKDGKIKIRWKVKLPVVVSEAECMCPGGMVRENFADVVVTVHNSSPTAERTDIALSLKDLVASPEFQASIINLQTPSA